MATVVNLIGLVIDGLGFDWGLLEPVKRRNVVHFFFSRSYGQNRCLKHYLERKSSSTVLAMLL